MVASHFRFGELTTAQRQAAKKRKALAYVARKAGPGSLTGWHRDFARVALRDSPGVEDRQAPAEQTPVTGPSRCTRDQVWAVLQAPRRGGWGPDGACYRALAAQLAGADDHR